MNENIRELSSKAHLMVNEIYRNLLEEPDGDFDEWYHNMVEEKFAELIIRECINCCDDSQEEYAKNVDWGVDRIVARFNLQPIKRKEPVPKCSVCGTTENVSYVGGFQPWLCGSVDCIPF